MKIAGLLMCAVGGFFADSIQPVILFCAGIVAGGLISAGAIAKAERSRL